VATQVKIVTKQKFAMTALRTDGEIIPWVDCILVEWSALMNYEHKDNRRSCDACVRKVFCTLGGVLGLLLENPKGEYKNHSYIFITYSYSNELHHLPVR